MSEPSQQFHLFLDVLSPPTQVAGADKIEVPAGISFLEAPVGQPPRLLRATEMRDAAFLLEPILRARQPRLLLISPGTRRVRVNGQPAPRLTLLSVKDQVQFTPDYLLHVTLYHRSSIGPPAPAAIGRECPICRAPFLPSTTVYVCPACATPVHCEGEERGAERLECIRLGPDCPVCGAPVLPEGYSYVPELCRG
jgi:hypothetical protein